MLPRSFSYVFAQTPVTTKLIDLADVFVFKDIFTLEAVESNCLLDRASFRCAKVVALPYHVSQ